MCVCAYLSVSVCMWACMIVCMYARMHYMHACMSDMYAVLGVGVVVASNMISSSGRAHVPSVG